MRFIIVASLVALGLGLGLVFGVFDGGSNTKKASTTTATTNTTPATTTTATTTTAAASTPTITTASTGGGSIPPVTPSVPAATTTVIVQPPVVRLNVRPSAHGLVTAVQLLGPVALGGTTPFDATVYKVSGPPLIAPVIAFGDEFNSRPTGNFASLNIDSGIYSFADPAKNWFQMPDLKIGDTFNVHGTVVIRPPGGTVTSYCLSATVGRISVNPSYDANQEPLPAWRELAKSACGRISFR